MEKSELERAKDILTEGGYTCVLCSGERVHKSAQRGVRPLLDWLREGCVPKGCSAADKVVGKGAALLYVLLGAKAVYGAVMSRHAMNTLRANGIEAHAGELVPAIRNRSGDGFCPMESATLTIDDPREGLAAMERTLAALMTDKTR